MSDEPVMDPTLDTGVGSELTNPDAEGDLSGGTPGIDGVDDSTNLETGDDSGSLTNPELNANPDATPTDDLDGALPQEDGAPIDPTAVSAPPTPRFKGMLPDETEEQAFERLNRFATQSRQELASLKRDFEPVAQMLQGRDPSEVARILQAQEQEQQARSDLKPWMRGHPDSEANLGSVQKVRAVQAQIASLRNNPELNDETRYALQRQAEAQLTPEDWERFQQHSSDLQDSWFLDPYSETVGTIEQVVPQMVHQIVQGIFSHQQQTAEVDKYFSDHQELMGEVAPLMQDVMNAPQEGRMFEVAQGMASAYDTIKQQNAKIAELETRLSGNLKTTESAEAQIEANQQRATVPRSPATQPVSAEEIAAQAAEDARTSGIRIDNSELSRKLMRSK